jgi:hypothetical protein
MTGCVAVKAAAVQLKYFPGRLSPGFIVLGDWLLRLTVTWFRRLTSHNDILLLCRRPMLALEFEPPTPCASPKSGPTLTARSNHSRAFSIRRSAQYSRATVQIMSGSLLHIP